MVHRLLGSLKPAFTNILRSWDVKGIGEASKYIWEGEEVLVALTFGEKQNPWEECPRLDFSGFVEE